MKEPQVVHELIDSGLTLTSGELTKFGLHRWQAMAVRTYSNVARSRQPTVVTTIDAHQSIEQLALMNFRDRGIASESGAKRPLRDSETWFNRRLTTNHSSVTIVEFPGGIDFDTALRKPRALPATDYTLQPAWEASGLILPEAAEPPDGKTAYAFDDGTWYINEPAHLWHATLLVPRAGEVLTLQQVHDRSIRVVLHHDPDGWVRALVWPAPIEGRPPVFQEWPQGTMPMQAKIWRLLKEALPKAVPEVHAVSPKFIVVEREPRR